MECRKNKMNTNAYQPHHDYHQNQRMATKKRLVRCDNHNGLFARSSDPPQHTHTHKNMLFPTLSLQGELRKPEVQRFIIDGGFGLSNYVARFFLLRFLPCPYQQQLTLNNQSVPSSTAPNTFVSTLVSITSMIYSHLSSCEQRRYSYHQQHFGNDSSLILVSQHFAWCPFPWNE